MLNMLIDPHNKSVMMLKYDDDDINLYKLRLQQITAYRSVNVQTYSHTNRFIKQIYSTIIQNIS